MNNERIALAEKIIKVMAQAMSPYEGEARTAANMALEMMEMYGFTKMELKLSNGFDPKWFERCWTACEFYWDDGAPSFESTDTAGPNPDYDYGAMPHPMNWTTGHRYQGHNIDRLHRSARANGFTSNMWAGWRQWKRKGFRIKDGQEKNYTVIWFYDELEYEDKETGELKKRRHYFRVRVWNSDQIIGFAA